MSSHKKTGHCILVCMSLFLILLNVGCTDKQENMTEAFTQFLEAYEAKVVDLTRERNLVYFEATMSGKDELYQKWEELELQLNKIYADKDDFAKLKAIKDSGAVEDPLLKRQLDLIYNAYLGNQVDEQRLEEMIQLQTEIEKKFSTYRAEMEGKQYTDNKLEDILKTSSDSEELMKAWMASKQVGKVVEEDVLRLVKMRNQAAVELGFPNFHTMQLQLSDQDPEELGKLFDELDELTREAFAKLKADVDNVLVGKYQVGIQDLMPWHYQNRFFQEAPKIYEVDLDKYYKDKDLVALTVQFFAGIGLPVDDLIEKSDLFEREGKYQHAYCTDIDKEGDVRVVCNVKPNQRWMDTMLHEYGHAVYAKFTDRDLPWTLRDAAHMFTTEAIANMFGRMASNPVWMVDVIGISQEEADKIAEDCFRSLRLQQLVFSRWAQVMYRFEKEMYANPDQDLNKLWWDMVEKYQMLKRPEGRDEPDWASKIHVALYPVYYHNYLMGELLASQLLNYITEGILQEEDVNSQSFAGQKAVGGYLIEKVFKPGMRYYWNDMIDKATGEKLTAKYFAQQFVE
jgi:peptidyl-dipeptidase A